MAVLLSCQNLAKSFGSRAVFEDVTFGVFEGERLGMIGPNGSGKSTFLKILAGLETPDAGKLILRGALKVGYLAQKDEFDLALTIEDVLAETLKSDGLDPVMHSADIYKTLSQVGFTDPEQKVGALSGGWQKRLAIARVLIREPELVLMDEPTNHLDLEGILWLEKLLKSAPFATLVVSHDRRFLENLTTRMVEFNAAYPGGTFSADGSYSEFLLKREDFLAGQKRQEEALANRVRREVDWLRHGAKARTTKAKSRIKEAGVMIEELADLKGRNTYNDRTAEIDFTASGRKTKRLAHFENVSKSFGDKTVLQNLTLTLSAGSKLGLAGFNGSGKSTLLKLLTGELKADSGKIETALNLKIVTFSQQREQLNLNLTLKEALSSSGDQVIYRGRSLHVSSWARMFLFRPEELDISIKKLSGGEQARLLIARLMLEEADLLLLDEPTNDLDIPTLEVLEESLEDFPGALVLVTHDRYMLDSVSQRILGLDGNGDSEFFADYEQWERWILSRNTTKMSAKKTERKLELATPKKTGRLSYNEQREWDMMEANVLAAENALALAQKNMDDPNVAADSNRLMECCKTLQTAQELVDKLYARWSELEGKRGA